MGFYPTRDGRYPYGSAHPFGGCTRAISPEIRCTHGLGGPRLRTESGVVENGKPFAQKLADVLIRIPKVAA
jgi:hypothetical protein